MDASRIAGAINLRSAGTKERFVRISYNREATVFEPPKGISLIVVVVMLIAMTAGFAIRLFKKKKTE